MLGPTKGAGSSSPRRVCDALSRYAAGVPESSERRAELATLIRLMQADLDAEDASAVPSIVENVVSETPFTERAARNLIALLPKLGRAAYDMAIKLITDIGPATVKKILGLP